MTQQTINIGTMPGDSTGDPAYIAFTKSNENFTELYAKGATEGVWNYNKTDTNTTTAPVSGRFKTNSGNYRDATQLAIHATTIQGIDRANTLRSLIVGDVIQCQDSTNGAAWCRYTLQSLPVDNTTWFQLNVAYITDGGVASGDNQEINFIFTAENVSGGGGGGITDAPSDGVRYVRQNASWVSGDAAYATPAQLALKADLASPTFTGDPKAPTPATADNDTSIATTAFVKAQSYITSGALAPYAPLASPVFTGDPQAPTPATADNDTSVATTAFVKAQGYLTGNQTVTLSGDVTGAGTTAIAATIANNAVTNAKVADMTAPAFKGRTTAGTGDPEDLTPTQATALLNAFTSALKGLAPASGGGTTNFLRADATWAAPPGGAGGTTISDTPPGSPTAGSLWWESDTGTLWIFYNDGTSSQWVAAAGGGASAALPTYQIFTSGSGTYTTPANCRRIEIEMVGGGAGGAGGAGGGNGTAGGTSTFGPVSAGGAGANSGLLPGGPGSGSGGNIANFTGGYGGAGTLSSTGVANAGGGMGGATIFGGAGSGIYNAAGTNAAANTGGGGGGGGCDATAVNIGASGGSAGGALRHAINGPAATYSYSVGPGGIGGAAGTGGFAGGNGAAGIIIVKEIY